VVISDRIDLSCPLSARISVDDLFFVVNILSVSCAGKGKLFVQLWIVWMSRVAAQCA